MARGHLVGTALPQEPDEGVFKKFSFNQGSFQAECRPQYSEPPRTRPLVSPRIRPRPVLVYLTVPPFHTEVLPGHHVVVSVKISGHIPFKLTSR